MPRWPITQILVPVESIDASLAFYQGLGFTLKFRDGERFAALDGGKVTLALVSGTEDLTPGSLSFAVSVDDIEHAVAEAVANGATLVAAINRGPDEKRASLIDRDGNSFVLYSKL